MQHRPSIPLTGHQRSHGLTVVLLEEALSLNREMGNEREATPALPPLAEETRNQGGHAGAARLNQETLNRRTDETWRPSALDGMASVVAAREEEEQAARPFGPPMPRVRAVTSTTALTSVRGRIRLATPSAPICGLRGLQRPGRRAPR